MFTDHQSSIDSFLTVHASATLSLRITRKHYWVHHWIYCKLGSCCAHRRPRYLIMNRQHTVAVLSSDNRRYDGLGLTHGFICQSSRFFRTGQVKTTKKYALVYKTPLLRWAYHSKATSLSLQSTAGELSRTRPIANTLPPRPCCSDGKPGRFASFAKPARPDKTAPFVVCGLHACAGSLFDWTKASFSELLQNQSSAAQDSGRTNRA